MDDDFEHLADKDQLAKDVADSERIAQHVESKNLHKLLECTLDPLESDEFGGGACLYHAGVCVIAYERYPGQLAFDVLHPADDRHLCQEGVPAGFAVPWDFDAKLTAKLVRQLATKATELYLKLGISELEPLPVEIDFAEMERELSGEEA